MTGGAKDLQENAGGRSIAVLAGERDCRFFLQIGRDRQLLVIHGTATHIIILAGRYPLPSVRAAHVYRIVEVRPVTVLGYASQNDDGMVQLQPARVESVCVLRGSHFVAHKPA